MEATQEKEVLISKKKGILFERFRWRTAPRRQKSGGSLSRRGAGLASGDHGGHDVRKKLANQNGGRNKEKEHNKGIKDEESRR